MKTVEVVIIGGGPGGIAAAIWCKRLGISHILLERAHELGGQLEWVQNQVVDYPGLIEGTGRDIKQHFIKHAEHLGCSIVLSCNVLSIDVADHFVHTDHFDYSTIHYQYLVMATGASDRRLGVPGEGEMLQRGETYSASADGELFARKPVVVVGGGDRALEGSLLLANQGANVTLVHRSNQYRAREEFIAEVKQHKNISMLEFCEVIEIIGQHEVSGVKLKFSGHPDQILPANAVFVRIGIKPNSHLLKSAVDVDREGFIVTDKIGKTNVKNIYAVGDVCTIPVFTSISTATGQAMMAVKDVSERLKAKA